MNYKELTGKYQQFFDFIARNRIKDALDTLAILCNQCRNRDLRALLDIHADTYRNILKYTFELSHDPQKQQVHSRLIRDIIALADAAREDIIRTYDLLKYYKLRFESETYSDKTVADLTLLVDQLMLQKETGEDFEAVYHTRHYQENIRTLFTILWHSNILKYKEIELTRKICMSDGVAWYDKCIMVSALSLSLIRHFDSNKIGLLFDFYENGEHQVWERALVSLVLGMAYYDKRLIYYPEIWQRLKAIQGMKRSDKNVQIIIQQFLKARETDKITRKIQDEILPEMIKIKSRLEEKLDLDNLIASMHSEEKNPEWETFFQDSPDMYNKMEEFTNLQLEGADVFLSAFAMLKQFDFFNDPSHWFLPFYKDNENISASFEGSAEGMDLKQLGDGIERSHFLCNSDKYSFCLNIRQMPAFQKSTVLELFNMELKAMNEMAMDDELLHSDALAQVTIKQYFQDLYRFYKLHPLKAEFEDIFALPPDIYETQFFRLWIEDMSVFRNLGEYFFAKNYYVEALHVFRQIVEKSNNYELYEKIGYCYQQLGDFGNALANYHKAELLDKNRFWLINHIAYCFRKLGEFPKALEYYHEAEKFSPEDLGIQASLGQVYMETGNFETALKFYFKVEYLQPENHKVLRPISWCSFMLGKFDNALKYIEKSLQNHVTKNDLLNLGHIHWCMGNTMKASESYLQGYQKSNFDAEWFSRVMLEDGKYLQKFEVDIFDLPLMIDYVLLQG